MLVKYPEVSYCIAVYNEEEILKKSLIEIKKSLNKIIGVNKFEIIIVDNGSTDNTSNILNSLNDPIVRSFFIKEKGHGRALRKAIKEARGTHIVITAIDIPFGFEDLIDAKEYWNQYDIVFGSKAHPDSRVSATAQRMVASIIYRFLLRMLFGISIRDTQGSLFIKRSKIMSVVSSCDANNAFFTSQLAIYGKKKRLSFKEIPVTMNNTRSNRTSRYKLLKDGPEMLKTVFSEYRKFKSTLTL